MNEKSKKGFQPIYLVAIAYVLVVCFYRDYSELPIW